VNSLNGEKENRIQGVLAFQLSQTLATSCMELKQPPTMVKSPLTTARRIRTWEGVSKIKRTNTKSYKSKLKIGN